MRGESIRAAVNAILTFIGLATLSDEEYDWLVDQGITGSSTPAEVYAAMVEMLDARDATSAQKDRLRSYFLAKNADIGEAPETGDSNVFIGSVLE